MRSGAFAWLARTIGIKTYLLEGGYKSYRKWVLNQFEVVLPIRLIGGKTGTRKTDLLNHIHKENIHVIDLEGIANHRGSSFGSLGMEKQPTTQQFENILAESLDEFHKNDNTIEIWLEAESSNLGKCRIPNMLYSQMQKAPILEIIKTKNERVENLVNLYSQNSQKELENAVERIQKRLGPQRTNPKINLYLREIGKEFIIPNKKQPIIFTIKTSSICHRNKAPGTAPIEIRKNLFFFRKLLIY